MQKRSIVLVSALLVVVGGVFWFYQKDAPRDTKPIRIGVVLPLSGSFANQGEWMRNALEMAKEDAVKNSALKKSIELVYEDDQCQPKNTTNALEKLIKVDTVRAFVGPFCGGSAHVAGIEADKERVVGISPGINFGKTNPYLLSTQDLLAREPEAMARFAFNELALRKVAVYYFNNEFGVVHRDTFVQEFEKLGGSITHVSAIEGFATQDYRTELTKIKTTNPEAVYVAYGGLGPIAKQLREIGYQGKILSVNSSENPDVVKSAGKDAEGIIYVHRGAEEVEKTTDEKTFLARYTARYGSTPGVVAEDSYDAFMLIMQALMICEETDGECIRQSIANTKDFAGVSGTFSINPETYAVTKPLSIKMIRDGQFVPYTK